MVIIKGSGADRARGLNRAMAITITLLFLSTLGLPFANAATTIIFVSPLPSQIIKGTIEVEVKLDTNPISVGLYVDDVYFTDMTYTGYDFTYWHFKYNLDTWGLYDGSHMVRVEARDATGNTNKGIMFFVDNYAPVLTDPVIIYPHGQTAAKKGDWLSVTTKVSDGVSGIKEVYCDATKLLAQNSIPMYDDGQHNDSVEGDGTYGSDAFKVGAQTNGFNILYVWAEDFLGNDAMTSIPVAMDNTPPRVLESIVEYPVGQQAVKLGDITRIVAEVEDKGQGGMLRIGTDIVLVLDNSGSMINGANPSMTYLKAAVKKFVNLSHPEDRIAIYAFSDDGNNLWEESHRYIDFTPMDENGKDLIYDFLDNDFSFNRAHNTPIWDTIGDGMRYAIEKSIHQAVVVAITDGTDYGYDWFERPDPSWWSDAYDWGFRGLGFERGSERYAPWNNWGTTVFHSTHYGEYPAPWPDDPEVHSFDVPIPDDGSFDDYPNDPGIPQDRDFSSGLRKGLLNAPVPVFTIGLGLPHHSPIMKNTTEYDLYRIATTSSNESIRGKYYHAPESNDLDQIYEDISFFINLAGDINITPPGGLRRFTADAAILGQEVIKPLYDDGVHNDVYEDDEIFGTERFDIKTYVTKVVNVTLEGEDIVGHPMKVKVEVLVDNTPPIIEDLVPHVLDTEGLNEIKTHYVSDGDMVFYTVNASDWGEVRGLTKVRLDASPIGGDKEFVMEDDGLGFDKWMGDGKFTSGAIVVKTGETDGFVQVTSTAYDIALNKASVSSDLLVLNKLNITGQIVEPLNGTYVRGMVEVHLALSDEVNVIGVNLRIFGPTNATGNSEYTVIMMVKDVQTGLYKAIWNTTKFPDYIYQLSGMIYTKADTEILTDSIDVFVDNTPPDVDILSPEEETIITDITRIQVLANDNFIIIDNAGLLSSVEYEIGDGFYKPMRAKDLSQPGRHNYYAVLDPTLMEDGAYVITVRAIDMAGWEAFDNVTVYVDTVPPLITPVYVPPVGTNISLDFNFAFKAEDTSGIDSAVIKFDGGGQEYALPFNTDTQLWEYELDTRGLKDGNHSYCVTFWDKVGLKRDYCSSMLIDNSDAPKPRPRKDDGLAEMPWWVILILAVSIAIFVIATILMVRDRHWRQQMEDEVVDRLAKEEAERMAEKDEVEAAPTVPLPPPLPSGPALPKPAKKSATEVQVDVDDKVDKRSKEIYELSAIAPVLVTEAKAKNVEKGPKSSDVEKAEPKKKKTRSKKKFVRCPMCKSKIKVKTDERPLVLQCDTCGAKGKLK